MTKKVTSRQATVALIVEYTVHDGLHQTGTQTNGRRLSGLINHILFLITLLTWGTHSPKMHCEEKGKPAECDALGHVQL